MKLSKELLEEIRDCRNTHSTMTLTESDCADLIDELKLLIDLLFQADSDKNDNLSDLEWYKYHKIYTMLSRR